MVSHSSALEKRTRKRKLYRLRDAHADLCGYIDSYYNQTRCHSLLRGLSHEDFETAEKKAATCPL